MMATTKQVLAVNDGVEYALGITDDHRYFYVEVERSRNNAVPLQQSFFDLGLPQRQVITHTGILYREVTKEQAALIVEHWSRVRDGNIEEECFDVDEDDRWPL
jgi:hypothetical protein